jgi:hypothetical protein
MKSINRPVSQWAHPNGASKTMNLAGEILEPSTGDVIAFPDFSDCRASVRAGVFQTL